MKVLFRLVIVIGLLGVAAVRAEAVAPEPVPELRGVLADASGKRFGLLIPGSEETAWVTVGQSIGGWKLKEYRAADDTLVLAKDGREEVLHLSESVVTVYHKGSQADAEALLKVMKLDERFAAAFKRGMAAMAKRALIGNGIANPTAEQIAAVQKILDGQVAGMAAQFQTGMATAMGEIYTQEDLKAQSDFYATDAGQTALDKMFGAGGKPGQREPDELKAFYATPEGQSVELKRPQVQAKIKETLQPLMMASMVSVQKAVADYAKQQQAPKAP